ncbi:MAG: hypothetical protein R3229_03005 [Alphaproteobacteria bacterium]|nr:hypothetical protein [Alphaproteobacteria bacterium]
MKPIAPGPAHANPLAEAVFVALETLDRITPAPGRTAISAHAGFDALYRFATDPTMAMDRELERALAESPRLRADLHRLVQRTAGSGALMAAAASSGTITTRRGTSFRMTLRESRADSNQVYVMIHLSPKAEMPPRTLFVIDDSAGCRKMPLPAPHDGTVQLLLEGDSDLVAALRDPATEVFVQ